MTLPVLESDHGITSYLGPRLIFIWSETMLYPILPQTNVQRLKTHRRCLLVQLKFSGRNSINVVFRVVSMIGDKRSISALAP